MSNTTYAVADQAYGSRVSCFLWLSVWSPVGDQTDNLNWKRTLLPQATHTFDMDTT